MKPINSTLFFLVIAWLAIQNQVIAQDVGISGMALPSSGSTIYQGISQTLVVSVKNYTDDPLEVGLQIPIDFIVNDEVVESSALTVTGLIEGGDSTGLVIPDFPFPNSIDKGVGNFCIKTNLASDPDHSNDAFCTEINYSDEVFDIGVSNVYYVSAGDTITGSDIPTPGGNDAVVIEFTNYTSSTVFPADHFVSMRLTVNGTVSNYSVSTPGELAPGESYSEVLIDQTTIPGFATAGPVSFCARTTIGDANALNDQRCFDYNAGGLGISELMEEWVTFEHGPDFVIVRAKPEMSGELQNVIFTDISGKEVSVYNFANHNQPVRVSTHGLTPGLYVLSVVSERGRLSRKVLIQ